MKSTVAVSITLLLCACHQETKAPDDAKAPPPVVPMGMASAATLVAATNPVEVVAKLHHPRDLALGGDQIFAFDAVGESGDADVVALAAAPAAPKRIVGEQHAPQGLAWASGRLVWVVAAADAKKEGNKVAAADKSDSAKIVTAKPDAPKPTATLIAKTFALDETQTASDGTDVFTFGDVKDDKCDLMRIPATGKPVRVAVAGPKVTRRAIAVNGSQVFWVQDGSIVWAPKAGGATTPVVKLPSPKIQRLVADDTSVYWTDMGTGDPAWSGRVYRAPIVGGKPETISDAPSPVGIALDADSVYWTSSPSSGGRVLAQKKSGGPTLVLAKDQHSPRFLAVDAKYAYWTNEGDGDVFRTEKGARKP